MSEGKKQVGPCYTGRSHWFVQRDGVAWRLTMLFARDETGPVVSAISMPLPPEITIREWAVFTDNKERAFKGWRSMADEHVMSIEAPGGAHVCMSSSSWLIIADRMAGREGHI